MAANINITTGVQLPPPPPTNNVIIINNQQPKSNNIWDFENDWHDGKFYKQFHFMYLFFFIK